MENSCLIYVVVFAGGALFLFTLFVFVEGANSTLKHTNNINKKRPPPYKYK
jgi:hypothetical protein